MADGTGGGGAPWGRGYAEAIVWALHSGLISHAARAASIIGHLEPEPSSTPPPAAPDVLEVSNIISSRAMQPALNLLRPNMSFNSILATLESGDFAPYEGQEAALLPLLAVIAHLRAQGDAEMEERVARILLRLERHGLPYDAQASGAAPPLNRTLHALRTHSLRIVEDNSAARLLNYRFEQHEATALYAAANDTTSPPSLRVQVLAKHVNRAAHYWYTRGADSPLVGLQVRAAAALASASNPPQIDSTPFLISLWNSAPALRSSTALLLASLLRNRSHLPPSLTATLLTTCISEAPDPNAHSSLLVACAAHASAPSDKQRNTQEWLERSLRSNSPPSGAQLTAAVFFLADEPVAAHAAHVALTLLQVHVALRPVHLLPLFRLFRAAANERAADAQWFSALSNALLSPSPPLPLSLPLLIICTALMRPTPAPIPPILSAAIIDELQSLPPPPPTSLDDKEKDAHAEVEAVRLYALLEGAVAFESSLSASNQSITPLIQRSLACLYSVTLPLPLLSVQPFSLSPLERHAASPLFTLAAPLSRALSALVARASRPQRGEFVSTIRTRAHNLNAALAPHVSLLLSPRAPGRRAAVRLLQAEHLVCVVVLGGLAADSPSALALTADECIDALDSLAALDFFRAPLASFVRLVTLLITLLANARTLDAYVVRQCTTILSAPPRELLPSSRAAFYLLVTRLAAPRLSAALVVDAIGPAVAEALSRGDAIGRAAHSTAAALLNAHGLVLSPMAPYMLHCSLSAFPSAIGLTSVNELLRALVRSVPDDASVLLACNELPPRVAALYANNHAQSARLLSVLFFRLLLLARLSLLLSLQRLVVRLIETAFLPDRPGLVRAVQQLTAASLDYQRKHQLIDFYHTQVLPLALAVIAKPPSPPPPRPSPTTPSSTARTSALSVPAATSPSTSSLSSAMRPP